MTGYRGRPKPPPRDVLDAITAAAARGDEAEVERLSTEARAAHTDHRRQAEPLDGLA